MPKRDSPAVPPASDDGPRGRRWTWWVAGILLLLVAAGIAAVLWLQWKTRVSEKAVQRAVVTTLQEESPASFYVTGTLQLTATATVRNTKTLLPNVLDLSMGTTEATVRMPGRVSYGFDVASLRAEDIRLRENGVVEVTLPPLAIHAVEPDLSEMQVKTSVGWARLYSSSGRKVERQATLVANKALRRQARRHLDASTQPQVNTAKALQKLLVPILKKSGVSNPQLRIQVGPELVMEPEG